MRELKPVMFGKKDVVLYDKVKDMKNFSGYVKRLIREDLAKQSNDTTVKTADEKLDELLELIKSGAFNTAVVGTDGNSTDTNVSSSTNDEQARKTVKAVLGMFDDEDDEE